MAPLDLPHDTDITFTLDADDDVQVSVGGESTTRDLDDFCAEILDCNVGALLIETRQAVKNALKSDHGLATSSSNPKTITLKAHAFHELLAGTVANEPWPDDDA